MQHLGAVIRQLRRFANVDLRHHARVRHDSGVRGEQTRDVFPQRYLAGSQDARQEGRGQVGPAAPQSRDLAVGRGAEKARHDGDCTGRQHRLERAARAPHGAAQVRGGVAERAVGLDHVRRVHVGGGTAARFERGGEQLGRESFAPRHEVIDRAGCDLAQHPEPTRELLELDERRVDAGDQLVEPGATRHQGARGLGVPGAKRRGAAAHLRGVAARCAGRAIEQGIGHAAHRRYDHDLWGRAVGDHDLHGVRDAGGVRERRAAELVDVWGGGGGPGHGVSSSRGRRQGGPRGTSRRQCPGRPRHAPWHRPRRAPGLMPPLRRR